MYPDSALLTLLCICKHVVRDWLLRYALFCLLVVMLIASILEIIHLYRLLNYCGYSCRTSWSPCSWSHSWPWCFFCQHSLWRTLRSWEGLFVGDLFGSLILIDLPALGSLNMYWFNIFIARWDCWVWWTEKHLLSISQANIWLGTLLLERSEDIYRMKGLLSVDGMNERFVFQVIDFFSECYEFSLNISNLLDDSLSKFAIRSITSPILFRWGKSIMLYPFLLYDYFWKRFGEKKMTSNLE